MLQEVDGSICEMTVTNASVTTGNMFGGIGQTNSGDYLSNTLLTTACIQTYWYYGSYPVYVCTDKTKKAIEVLKALQSEKLLDCKSVPRFIELVEKISNLL